ncbi:prepilin-type N-terminal cleavage/methylation domain-containing protein [Glaciimonas sp. Gout2]|uniref:type II secretion system protein n=1 Tax=unclassified Glaciimonas TaxID=2644401 RepID=UPI002AB3459D|nr:MULTISPECIES: prepilin-type N-terminal cleavage/methylation domain-containing protein [unclassified Glaciimonas]MDY7548512.1 prepilin-type N-terminal cleavage/methylation domain-containing protein [Glaciimonas sp. CA11.2]MEB0013702.1 prepilin-type N-terminal cleavage/methylation domain-containing protein [Glaciimonas sp. Cout2]MEB0084881.1 prepilin-type N-terminal cleavage/methylation domain-containing protein [Glaciimonas sp. Gout2]
MAFRITNGKKGFTLIELLVVMAIIATLMTLVAPKYFKQTERAKEVVLQHNIRGLREAIDNYRQDLTAGPQALEDLVSRRYLKEVPLDPVTGRRDTWLTELNEDSEIQEVRSGAPGTSLGGGAYAEW